MGVNQAQRLTFEATDAGLCLHVNGAGPVQPTSTSASQRSNKVMCMVACGAIVVG